MEQCDKESVFFFFFFAGGINRGIRKETVQSVINYVHALNRVTTH